MPKWNDRQPVAPQGSGVKPKAPIVDISPPSLPASPVVERPADPRVPTTVIPPKPKHLERLKIDRIPSTEGIKYEVENIGGMTHYAVMLRHKASGATFVQHAKDRTGYVVVPNLSKMRGVWDAVLLIDLEIADRVEVEFELTLEWLAEAIGRAKIFFGPTDGPLDRLGAVIMTPYPKKASIPATQEDVVIYITLDEVPDVLPDVLPDSARMVVQVLRPGDAGIYYREEIPVCGSVCYRMKVANYLPCSETGDWSVVVSLGSKVLGHETIKVIPARGRAVVTSTEKPLEEFQARLVS